jgi:hypothetical protein
VPGSRIRWRARTAPRRWWPRESDDRGREGRGGCQGRACSRLARRRSYRAKSRAGLAAAGAPAPQRGTRSGPPLVQHRPNQQSNGGERMITGAASTTPSPWRLGTGVLAEGSVARSATATPIVVSRSLWVNQSVPGSLQASMESMAKVVNPPVRYHRLPRVAPSATRSSTRSRARIHGGPSRAATATADRRSCRHEGGSSCGPQLGLFGAGSLGHQAGSGGPACVVEAEHEPGGGPTTPDRTFKIIQAAGIPAALTSARPGRSRA